MLRAGVQVVVVGGEPGFSQPFGLVVGEHSRRHTGFHAHAANPAHHLQHGFEGSTVADFPPGPAHAEPIGARFLRGAGPLQHGLHLHLRLEGRHITAVVD